MQDHLRRTLVAALLLVAGTLIQPDTVHAAADDTEQALADNEASAYDGDLSEDDELDEDDGSRSLDNQPRLIDVEQLKPVSQAEEQTLLGDWGDSENED